MRAVRRGNGPLTRSTHALLLDGLRLLDARSNVSSTDKARVMRLGLLVRVDGLVDQTV